MTDALDITKEVIEELIGTDLSPLLDILKDKKHISEFNLAEKLKINVNQIRNMLYKLSSYNIVTSTRKRDQKKGWYVYYWNLNMPKIRELILNHKKKQLEEINTQIAEERTHKYFTCPTNCVRLNYEDALEIQFHCPECGSILQEKDNKFIIDKLNKATIKLMADITYVEDAEKEFSVKKIVEKKPKKIKKKAVKKKPKKVKKSKPKKKIIKKKVKKSKPKNKGPVKKAIKKKRIIKSPKKLIKKFGRLFV